MNLKFILIYSRIDLEYNIYNQLYYFMKYFFIFNRSEISNTIFLIYLLVQDTLLHFFLFFI